MNIALLGYGTVGKAVDSILSERDTGIRVTKIFRRPGKATAPRMTDNFESILADDSIDVVVEVLAGKDPAFDLITRALQAGKHVVTSNKAALANDMPGLLTLAKQKGVSLQFEAACGGGMPIVEAVKKAVLLDEVTQFKGILNGTCNYILDRMDRFGDAFTVALSKAQALGYAEADPTADISGADVKNKAIIALSIAFKTPCVTDFPTSGIEKITDAQLANFMARGKRLRLMLIAKRTATAYALGVVPVVVNADSFEASVKENFNFAAMTCDLVGDLIFYGQGAGGKPTADAVIQDIIAVKSQRAYLPEINGHLAYDESILTGTGYIGDDVIENAPLATLVRTARERGAFLAFEPN
ncbi:MAG TPA: hypothetical protein DCW60_01795, partial [Sutterella sp.]|nr:hypothetical protein [Sutterella sp.]